MALVYKLVGFDRATETLSVARDIPSNKVSQAKKIAGIADNPAVIADWPLSRAHTDLIDARIDVEGMDWALEPYPLDPLADRAKIK